MIGYLKGTLLETETDRVLLDVGGVGYELHIPLSTYYEVQKVEEGGTAAFRIHTHVREDALLLYGFWTQRERIVFERLIAVSGIGPRLAQTILSGMACDDLIAALSQRNPRALQSIPGVGKKTAERMVLELEDKVRDLPSATAADTRAPTDSDLVAALTHLGYRRNLAEKAVAQVLAEHPDQPFADQLRNALSRLSRV